jgi:glycosyltransferase involved in cell wall biosynthesis
MRIVHADAGRELRGGQRQVLLLARALERRGHSQVILAHPDSALYTASRDCGFQTVPLRLPVLFREAGRADVVHAHDARAHTLAALAGCRPLVVSRRVAFPPRAGPLSRWKYGRTTRFLAVSNFVKEQLLAAGIDDEKISVVYDGVSVPDVADTRPRRGHVLAPASADPQKGSALAAEACRMAGVELQFSANLAEDLPQAALFLYLTRSEGLGSAILLAMAHKTPVVASRVGGVPEIVEHGSTGLLVENAPARIAEAILHVFTNPDQAAVRAAAAHAQILGRFSSDTMAAQTERAYEQAIGCCSRRVYS